MNEIMKILRERVSLRNSVRIIRQSGLFDDRYYLDQLGEGERSGDLIAHYVSVGENLGFRPSEKFDPRFYGGRYPDVALSGRNLLSHFVTYGIREGRLGRAQTEEFEAATVALEKTKRTILLLVHELSRTGAPILGWNIGYYLKRNFDYNIVVISLSSGDIAERFHDEFNIVIPFNGISHNDEPQLRSIATSAISQFKPDYILANSMITFPLANEFFKLGAPVIGLVHEFATFAVHMREIAKTMQNLSELVFPAEVVRRSSFDKFPSLKMRPSHIIAQGRSEVPHTKNAAKRGVNALAEFRNGADFVVIGVGTLEWRKGVDLFVCAAAAAKKRAPKIKLRFTWIGSVHGSGYELKEFLNEQVVRSDVTDVVEFLEAVPDLDWAYASADAFFLSSRLDPLPNVSIEAVSRGLPLVCFEHGSGMAEIMSGDIDARQLVVPYLDASAAADVFVKMASDQVWMRKKKFAMQRISNQRFDMDAYVRKLDTLGRNIARIGT
ncbi:glycosyltransferase [Mesorhizobium sp. M3A.F.Ca.ET.080.04.2.1]|uniref:glycosyltransferase n=1 Tax=Mesorhizobium sp. M3A.F.Ca.ET.080.04.2.1 TaxID=2493676 RepID=UPI0013EE0710|nr:glycosyltransferase [Mesorhizobium sp. M3A.F.Ca.ET.080.04.2.1]